MTGDERDSKGRFTKKTLDSDTAKDMQARRWVKPREDAAKLLLAEAGYSEDNPAPEYLRILVDIAVSKKASAVPAMREVLRLTSKQDAIASPGKPGPGTICPLCGELVFTDFRPTDGQLDDASEYLDNTIV